MDVEVMFLMKYKINPFEIFKDLTLLDFESYIRRIENKISEQEKEDKKNNNFGKSLVALRDLLNYMTLGQ